MHESYNGVVTQADIKQWVAVSTATPSLKLTDVFALYPEVTNCSFPAEQHELQPHCYELCITCL